VLAIKVSSEKNITTSHVFIFYLACPVPGTDAFEKGVSG
jgi:hypothetical protein